MRAKRLTRPDAVAGGQASMATELMDFLEAADRGRFQDSTLLEKRCRSIALSLLTLAPALDETRSGERLHEGLIHFAGLIRTKWSILADEIGFNS